MFSGVPTHENQFRKPLVHALILNGNVVDAGGDSICIHVSKTYLIKVVIRGYLIVIIGQYIVYDRSAWSSKYALYRLIRHPSHSSCIKTAS